MKLFLTLLVAALALHNVLAVPARLPVDDVEEIDVPRRRLPSQSDADLDTDFRDFKGVIDTGVGYPFLQPNPHSFSFNLGFFDSFEDIFRRLRTRLWPAELPGADGDTGDSSEEGGFNFNIDPKNGNTTSTVKIVDGHKIEVNETVYGDANNLFKVRVVNIRPVESGEDGAGGDDSVAGNANPVTSAPGRDGEPGKPGSEVLEGDADVSDERREPLEKKPADNEIRGNIDDPETTTEQQYELTTMLPTTDENNAANLNAEFVTDNGLEAEYENGNGNIEAETNMPDNEHEDNGENSENYDAAALDEEQSNGDAVSSLTIENNEEAEANGNFNESSEEAGAGAVAAADDDDDDGDVAVEKASRDGLSELPLSGEAKELRAELDEDAEDNSTENIDDVTGMHSAAAAAATADDDEELSEKVVVNSSAMHSNYANKEREDAASSSDDEESVAGADVEMQPAFNSEWAHLAEDLAIVNDKNNDLNNDIDVYDSVPVDLSNDIAVNDVAAAQPNYPINPDAEFVDVAGVLTNSTMPKFEKLSISAAMDPTSYQPASNTQNVK